MEYANDNWQSQKIHKAKSHQIKAFDLLNGLVVKSRSGKELVLNTGERVTEFCSCSYLGLDLDKRTIQAAMQNMQQLGISFAVARTRLQLENLPEFESLLDRIFCNAHTITFTSLHIAHLGLIPLLGSGEMPSYPIRKNGVAFILDKTVHACLQINRGLMLQFGEVKCLDANNLAELEQAFSLAHKENKTPILVSDSIGSMGGAAPIRSIMKLTDKYEGYAYFDDAHGTSVFGKNGCGYVLEQLNYRFHPRLILTASLSKGFGSNGAVVVLPTQADENMVRRFAVPYLFSNPPATPLVDAGIVIAKIHLSKEITSLQARLWENVNYFDSLMSETVINYNRHSPVRAIPVGDENIAIKFALELRKKGLLVTTAMYPTVAKGKSILRVAICANHTKAQIKKLCSSINEIARVAVKQETPA
jgi:7-keto-8-aminopelargonate synthetase-like enzyme